MASRALVKFEKVADARLRKIFAATLERYEFQREITVVLRGTRIKGSTMQAQPILGLLSLFQGTSRYCIRLGAYVRHSNSLLVATLDEEVLTGWFAHELGHVYDYHQRSTWDMIVFGIKYVVSRSFRRRVEHRADEIAIEQGFYKELISTKKFLFTDQGISPAYRKRLQKYYMSMDDLEEHLRANVMIDPVD